MEFSIDANDNGCDFFNYLVAGDREIVRFANECLTAASMGYEPRKFISIFRRVLACLWVAVGLWVVYSYLHHFDAATLSAIPALTVGPAFAICAFGFFFDKRWGRISIGCLMALVVLWSADMLLFIAFRGLDRRQLLLGVVAVLVFASICTWSILAATRRR